MTLSEIRTLVLSYLDDPNAGYFTDAQTIVWINNAKNEVQKRLIKAGQNYFVKCVTTSLVVNQRDYVLPQDFKKVHRLEVIVSGTPPNEQVSQIFPMTINQKDFVATGTGMPQFYYFKKNRLVLYPAPNQALTLRLLYTYEIVDMVNGSDEPSDIPSQYHELIALIAAEDGFIKDGRTSELLGKRLAEYKADMDSDAQERHEDASRSIVDTGSSYDGMSYW